MRIPENHVAVRVLKAWDGGALLNEQGKAIVGLGGKVLVQHDEGMHADEELLNKPGAVCVAMVVTPCDRFTEYPEVLTIGQEVFGSELFHLGEIAVGDKVAIKQNEMDLDQPIYTDAFGPVHSVPYSALLCIILAGELRPVGGYTLARPIMPPAAVKDLVNGKIEFVVKDPLGLVIETNVQPLSGQGKLAYLSKPLLGCPMPFYPGLRVLYNRWTSGPPYRIEGQNYFAVRHIDIAAVVDADEEVLSLGESRYSRIIKRPVRQA
jgi:hypothetical protein